MTAFCHDPRDHACPAEMRVAELEREVERLLAEIRRLEILVTTGWTSDGWLPVNYIMKGTW